jgi:hypothetical protein
MLLQAILSFTSSKFEQLYTYAPAIRIGVNRGSIFWSKNHTRPLQHSENEWNLPFSDNADMNALGTVFAYIYLTVLLLPFSSTCSPFYLPLFRTPPPPHPNTVTLANGWGGGGRRGWFDRPCPGDNLIHINKIQASCVTTKCHLGQQDQVLEERTKGLIIVISSQLAHNVLCTLIRLGQVRPHTVLSEVKHRKVFILAKFGKYSSKI